MILAKFLTDGNNDGVLGGEVEADARKIMAVRPKRFARFGLTIPPTQPARVSFRTPDGHTPSAMGNGTGDFLGLTHSWTTSRQGFWALQRRTARTGLRRTKQARWRGCRTHRQAPWKDQYHRRSLKLRGHCPYDGSRGNFRLLAVISHYAEKTWRYWLRRRSRKSAIRWAQFPQRLATYALPIPRIVTISDGPCWAAQ